MIVNCDRRIGLPDHDRLFSHDEGRSWHMEWLEKTL